MIWTIKHTPHIILINKFSTDLFILNLNINICQQHWMAHRLIFTHSTSFSRWNVLLTLLKFITLMRPDSHSFLSVCFFCCSSCKRRDKSNATAEFVCIVMMNLFRWETQTNFFWLKKTHIHTNTMNGVWMNEEKWIFRVRNVSVWIFQCCAKVIRWLCHWYTKKKSNILLESHLPFPFLF